MALSMTRMWVRASGGGALGVAALLLAACGGTLVGTPGGSAGASAGSAGASTDGSAGASIGSAGANTSGSAAGSGGASPVNGGAGGAPATVRFSPTSCKEAGGSPVPSKGGRQTPESDCESGVALGVIDAASSGWDEGGLCCAIGKDPAPKACGARAGDSCTATEFCAYEASQLCGAGDAEAVCKPRPDNCIELYAPVCGCDQKTYDNSCLANASGTGIYKAGTCN